MTVASDLERPVAVRILHGNGARHTKTGTSETILQIYLKKDGSDTIWDVKEKIAKVAAGGEEEGSKGSLTGKELLLSFGPNDRKMGCQYKGDPTVDEKKITLAQFSVLEWLERFPHWALSVRLSPDAPPPPGVCTRVFLLPGPV